jgi:hypothetical protein
MGRYTEMNSDPCHPCVVFAIARSFCSFMAPNQSILLIDLLLIVRGPKQRAREKADVGIYLRVSSKILAPRLA